MTKLDLWNHIWDEVSKVHEKYFEELHKAETLSQVEKAGAKLHVITDMRDILIGCHFEALDCDRKEGN